MSQASASQPETLAQWLSAIEAGHPTEIELGLERVARIADLLGLREPWPCPVVTLAGTNGKGSTQAYLNTICRAQGLRVGSYSSPHFLHYNERICRNGEPASDDEICQAFAAIDSARKQAGLSLSYFEFGTLAALWLFRRWELDLVLLEVGLGGRLDAVNIIDADIAVITTVALDHQDWLGDTREAVGFEKAGILRYQRPLVYGEPSMPESVSKRAEQLECPIYHWGQQFGPELAGEDNHSRAGWRWTGCSATGESLVYTDLPDTRLPFENAATALQVLALLPFELAPISIVRGLNEASLPGRRQPLRLNDRQLLLDVAHNPHAAEYLMEQLPPINGQTWCVLGMLADKDCRQTIDKLAVGVDCWLLADLDQPRGESAESLRSQLPADSEAECFVSPWQACLHALNHSAPDDRILIVGSFFTVADILRQLEDSNP